jgi:RNA polymerase subunit RPABC4/transcription elongation factor Spt4
MKKAENHICPRCQGPVPSAEHIGEYPGALSRTDNETEVCSACGTDEAFENAFGRETEMDGLPVRVHTCTPQHRWPIDKRTYDAAVTEMSEMGRRMVEVAAEEAKDRH